MLKMDMEAQLADLAKIGKPRVGIYGSGKKTWHAAVELDDERPGVCFEVDSGFKHATAALAVNTLWVLVQAVLAK